MKSAPGLERRLNIFALPNQTTIIFLAIVAVLIGTLLLGSVNSPYSIKSLALAVLLLPLRAFLAYPERELKRRQLVRVGSEFRELQDIIKNCAAQLGVRPPQLAIGPDYISPYTFGSWRYRYIAIGRSKAQIWQKEAQDQDLKSTVEARILHELYHFKTGDYWQLGYATALLRTTVFLMLWAVVFFIGLGSLLIKAKPMVGQLSQYAFMLAQAARMLSGIMPDLTPTVRQIVPLINEANQRIAAVDFSSMMIFSIGAVYPFVIMGFVLWKLYRPKLWRTREFYADGGVIYNQQTLMPYLSARTGIPLPVLRKYPQLLETKIKQAFKKTTWLEKVQRWRKNIRKLTSNHPDETRRLKAILHPALVFDDWKSAAFLAGSLAFVLEVLTMTPLTLQYAGRWPMVFPTLVMLIVISLNYLVPHIAQGRAVQTELGKIVFTVMVLRLVAIGFALLFFTAVALFAPQLFLQGMTAVTTDGLTANEVPAFLVKTVRSNLGQIGIVTIILYLALSAEASALKQIRAWPPFPRAEQHLRIAAYWIVSLTALVLLLTVLPLASILFQSPKHLLEPTYLVSEFSGLLLLGLGGRFFYQLQDCPEKLSLTQSQRWAWTAGRENIKQGLKQVRARRLRINARIAQRLVPVTVWWQQRRDGVLSVVRRYNLGNRCKRSGRLFVWGVVGIDLILIAVAHKIPFSHPVQNPRPVLYYAGWILGSLALFTSGYIITYRKFFRTWQGWLSMMLVMFVCNLLFQQSLLQTKLPHPLPFFLLALAALSFWNVVPATAVLLWYRDWGLRFFALGWIVIVWLVTLAWQYQGNLFELFLSFVQRPSVPWWMPIFLSISYLILPLALISFAGHTIRLLFQELFLYPPYKQH